VNPGTGGVIQRRARPRPNDCTLPAAASESSARCTVRWLVPSASARAELDHDSPSARKASTAACSSSTGPASTTTSRARHGANANPQEFPSAEAPGLSVFYKDGAGGVFHTYSTCGRGVELLMGTYRILDLVPKGRDEDHLGFPMEWFRYHDRYGTNEFTDADKPYWPETASPSSATCGCGSAEAHA
jgi:Bacterial protein of unknown function (DUF899)